MTTHQEDLKSRALSLLRQSLSDETAEFHSGQWEAIQALVQHQNRLLVVQRTGWGKSSVYFIATRLLRDQGRGMTLIVSPLLALMRNQIETAERLDVTALTINHTNRDNWTELEQTVLEDEADALLISPERLADESFMERISPSVGLLVVDEAHCISDWGHDFRPDYRRLIRVLQSMPPNLPILGTTATANDRVVDDVRSQLGDIGIQRGPLMRESLALQTMKLPTQAARLAWLAEHIDELTGTGIIYTLTIRDTEQVAAWLCKQGIAAAAYHSNLEDDRRRELEEKLLKNEVKALVATVALGMGFDKPDLGFVIHYQAPSSVIAYYQQIGRAGRGIERALCIMMTGTEDGEIHAYFRRTAFPNERLVQSILETLRGSDGMTVVELEEQVNARRSQIEHALKFLSVSDPAPVIKDGSKWRRTPNPFRLDREQIQRLSEQRENEYAEIREYVDHSGCLMEFLARALDDKEPQPCGKCANCASQSVVDPRFSHEKGVAAAHFLRHAEIPLVAKKQMPRDVFEEYEFRGLPAEHQAQEGRILSRWKDAGWGTVVADDKHAGSFRDELVEAVTDMLHNRWNPDPAPTWVACIPSRNHPTLVPDFAERLAQRLGLPFVPAIVKVKDNQPQKEQQNRRYQCKNLDGVFAIQGEVPNGPVLLVDDVVDSGWTLTIAGVLLRQAGSGPVWPLALATSNMGQ